MARMLDVLDRIRDLETDLQHEVTAAQQRWHYKIETGRVRFEEAVQRRHKALKMSLAQFLRESSIPALLTAPMTATRRATSTSCRCCGNHSRNTPITNSGVRRRIFEDAKVQPVPK